MLKEAARVGHTAAHFIVGWLPESKRGSWLMITEDDDVKSGLSHFTRTGEYVKPGQHCITDKRGLKNIWREQTSSLNNKN